MPYEKDKLINLHKQWNLVFKSLWYLRKIKNIVRNIVQNSDYEIYINALNRLSYDTCKGQTNRFQSLINFLNFSLVLIS